MVGNRGQPLWKKEPVAKKRKKFSGYAARQMGNLQHDQIKLINKIKDILIRDWERYVHPEERNFRPHPLASTCTIASEVYYWLRGKDEGYSPRMFYNEKKKQVMHFWLEHPTKGKLDITKAQLTKAQLKLSYQYSEAVEFGDSPNGNALRIMVEIEPLISN